MAQEKKEFKIDGENVLEQSMNQSVPSKAESEPVLSSAKRSQEDTPQRTKSDPNVVEKKLGTPPDSEQEDKKPDKISDKKTKRGPGVTESVRNVVIWTMTGFFDWNPNYFIRVRGIMNLLHLILSLTCIVLLSEICKLSNHVGSVTDEFICKPPEMFLFVSSCGAFFTATLYLFCCMLSKSTARLLFDTSFEVSYFVLYFILLLTASITLMIAALSWDSDRHASGHIYTSTQTAAIIGLVNSIMYGVSAIWFFISHRFYDVSSVYQP